MHLQHTHLHPPTLEGLIALRGGTSEKRPLLSEMCELGGDRVCPGGVQEGGG